MKVIILKNNLLEAVNSVERAIGTGDNLPILKNILLEAVKNEVRITATNLEIAVRHTVSGKIIEEGITTIPFSVFSGIIKNLSAERIILEKNSNKAEISIHTDNYEAVIQTQNPDEFPIIPAPDSKLDSIDFSVGSMKEIFKSVIPAAHYSDIRPEISGIYVSCREKNEIVFVATDGFRLARKIVAYSGKQLPSRLSEGIIIPLQTVSEFLRVLRPDNAIVRFMCDENQVFFITETQQILSRLIDGIFPDYNAVIPKEAANEVRAERQEFLNGIKLAGFFSGRANDVTIKTNRKYLEINSAHETLGRNSYKISAHVSGDPFSINFNWRYILDGLKIYQGDTIILGVNGPDKPALLKSPTEADMLYVVMPLRI